MHATDSKTLSGAMRTLAAVIQAPDNIPEMAMLEAAQRIDDLVVISLEMLAMLPHSSAMSEGCPACDIRARLESMGVRS